MVVEVNGVDVEFDEVIQIFDSHGAYCQEVEVQGYDDEGVEYSAIGTYDGFDITEIEEDSIEVLG